MDVAGWAYDPAKSGCQNKKVAAHMCAACGRFSEPAPGHQPSLQCCNNWLLH